MAAFAHTSVSGLRTRILGEKPSTGVLKPKLSRPRQDASFTTRFGPAISNFSINLPAKAAQRHYLALLPNRWPGRDRRDAGQIKGARFYRSNQSRYLDWNFGHDHSEGETDGAGKRIQTDSAGGAAISQRHYHGWRALQQDHRHLDARRR